MVRGLVGIDVVSLKPGVRSEIGSMKGWGGLHGETGEKFSQIPLRGRVREISNVKTASLNCTCNDGFILGSIDRITPSDIVCTSWCERSDAGGSQGFGKVVYGRHRENWVERCLFFHTV